MATLTAASPAWRYSMTGRFMAAANVLTAAAAVWKAGCFLRLTSSGTLVLCTTSAAGSPNKDGITHYSLTDLDTALGVATTYQKVGIVHKDDVYEMNAKSGTVTGAMIGNSYGLDVGATSPYTCTIDPAANATAVLKVVKPVWRERELQDLEADTLARVLVQVNSTEIDREKAAA